MIFTGGPRRSSSSQPHAHPGTDLLYLALFLSGGFEAGARTSVASGSRPELASVPTAAMSPPPAGLAASTRRAASPRSAAASSRWGSRACPLLSRSPDRSSKRAPNSSSTDRRLIPFSSTRPAQTPIAITSGLQGLLIHLPIHQKIDRSKKYYLYPSPPTSPSPSSITGVEMTRNTIPTPFLTHRRSWIHHPNPGSGTVSPQEGFKAIAPPARHPSPGKADYNSRIPLSSARGDLPVRKIPRRWPFPSPTWNRRGPRSNPTLPCHRRRRAATSRTPSEHGPFDETCPPIHPLPIDPDASLSRDLPHTL